MTSNNKFSLPENVTNQQSIVELFFQLCTCIREEFTLEQTLNELNVFLKTGANLSENDVLSHVHLLSPVNGSNEIIVLQSASFHPKCELFT